MLSIDNVSSGLPQGMETNIGEFGIPLSGGQRKRILLARAIYGCPDVIIIDEATSAIEEELEFRILGEIRETLKDVIIVVISHRTQVTLYLMKYIFFENEYLIMRRIYCAKKPQ